MSIDSHKHFQNTECRYFPCHQIDTINCLFCFCPLYHLENCGGQYSVIDSVKDCSNCGLPHGPNGWEKVIDRLKEEVQKKRNTNETHK
jgi:Zn-finger protein